MNSVASSYMHNHLLKRQEVISPIARDCSKGNSLRKKSCIEEPLCGMHLLQVNFKIQHWSTWQKTLNFPFECGAEKPMPPRYFLKGLSSAFFIALQKLLLFCFCSFFYLGLAWCTRGAGQELSGFLCFVSFLSGSSLSFFLEIGVE